MKHLPSFSRQFYKRRATVNIELNYLRMDHRFEKIALFHGIYTLYVMLLSNYV